MSDIFALCKRCGGFLRGKHASDCPNDPSNRPMLCGETRGSTHDGTFLACEQPVNHPPPCSSYGIPWPAKEA